MKEIELNNAEKIELSVKQKKEKEYTLIGTLVPHEGHTIWEINKETLEVKKASFFSKNYYMFGENKKEILVKKHCTYISALTKKTALEKYKKGSNGGKKLGNEKISWAK